ncbi:MAG: hypothetical protein ACOCZX_04035 [Candidatus Bipolaricaulota bacterium]
MGEETLRHLASGIGRELVKDQTVYVPYMSDHCHALVGAFRNQGYSAKLLPRPGPECLDYGRRYSEGGECLPFVVTTGQLIRLIEEEPEFEPRRAAFFMPTSSGPCRFGQYHAAQKLILDKLNKPVQLISLEASDSYGSQNLGLGFRNLAWQGIVGVDYLQKLLWQTRPYESETGETDSVYEDCLENLKDGMTRGGTGGLLEALDRAGKKFDSLSTESGSKPLVGIVGEIYVRANDLCNCDLVRLIEEMGGEVRVAPLAEWLYYTNRNKKQDGFRERRFRKFLKGWAKDLVQHYGESRVKHRFENQLTEEDLSEPPVGQLIENSHPYIPEDYRGEPVLEIGKAVDYAKKGADGIITVTPFSCMPGAMIISVSELVKRDNQDIPWLNLTFDAQQSTNIRTRLEPFLYQARKYRENRDREN